MTDAQRGSIKELWREVGGQVAQWSAVEYLLSMHGDLGVTPPVGGYVVGFKCRLAITWTQLSRNINVETIWNRLT